MKGLDVPVHNTYGLRPALDKGTNEIASLTAFRDLDSLAEFAVHLHPPVCQLPKTDLLRGTY